MRERRVASGRELRQAVIAVVGIGGTALLTASLRLLAPPASAGGCADGGPVLDSARALSLSAALRVRRPVELRFSPDGGRLAYVVREPDVDRNVYHTSLCVATLVAGTVSGQRLLREGEGIGNVSWTPDGRALLYVMTSALGRDVWRVEATSGRVAWLGRVDGALAGATPCRLAPDGQSVALLVWDTLEAGRASVERARTGIVYEPHMLAREVTDPALQPTRAALWVLDVGGRGSRRVWVAPRGQRMIDVTPEFAWSPDGSRLAVMYRVIGGTFASARAIVVVEVATGASRVVAQTTGAAFALAWRADGRGLTVRRESDVESDRRRYQFRRYELELSTGVWELIESDTAHALRPVDAEGSLTQRVERATEDTLWGCVTDAELAHVACVREAPTRAPEIVAADMRGAVVASPLRQVTHMNARIGHVRNEPVQLLSLRWGARAGTAGLVLPADATPRQRRPVLVMLYNLFTGHDYLSQAGWVNSWPVRAFTDAGYAVLMMNLPPDRGWRTGDFVEAKALMADHQVRAIRAALDTLAARGIADTTRLGLLGWSRGSFVADYIVTHHPAWFQAAASSERGLSMPAEYWAGGDEWRAQEDLLYGGGPYGASLGRWLELSPLYSAHRVRAPLLMEYRSAVPEALEFYEAITRQGGVAELVFYPDEEHVFVQPAHRLASMTRHLDWFNYWLLGRVDPDTTKREQYARWDRMRRHLVDREH